MTKIRKPKLDADRLSDEAQELKDFLEDRLVNQHRAVDAIVDAYNRFVSPLYSDDTPIVSALFAGPSGVGKTHLVELLAEFFYGDRKSFTKVECANYRQRHETAKLLGSPPGYVGFGEEAILAQSNIDQYALDNLEGTEEYQELMESHDELKMIQHYIDAIEDQLQSGDMPPQQEMGLKQEKKRLEEAKMRIVAENIPDNKLVSIILFDEVEKAHHALHNVLLEIMDKARTTMSDGEETSFANSFIIMTSNAGSEEITDELKGATLGFHSENEEYPVYEVAMEELKKSFPTEFLGRIEDSVVVFRHLDEEQLMEVMDIHLKEFRDKLDRKFPVDVVVSSWVKDYILHKSTDHPEYGARLIRHKLQKHLIDPIMRLINSGQVEKGDKVYVRKASNEKDIEFRKRVETEED